MTQRLNGIQAVEKVRDALASANLPRNSKLSGGEITGWTASLGHTGFSIRKNGSGITWSFPISGKPHLTYEDFRPQNAHEDAEGSMPVNPEKLVAPITEVFQGIGMIPHDVRCTGASYAWDDDVYYEVTTDMPDWLIEPA